MMKANFDNMRRTATAHMNALQEAVKKSFDYLDDHGEENALQVEIAEAFNDLAYSMDMLNCIYDDNIEDDANDLSDELEIKRIEFDDEEEDEDDE